MAVESVKRTFLVTLALAVVCSMLVSVSAVALRERQEANRLLDRQKNILMVTGLYDPTVPIPEAFGSVETRIVDLDTGEYVPAETIDPVTFDQVAAIQDPSTSKAVAKSEDIAAIARRERYSAVYLVKKDGKLDQVVLPVRGQGLWSMMWAFISLDADGTTVRGISYYQHGETAGLGAEIQNPAWAASWAGKKIYGDDGEVQLRVIKGEAPDASTYELDGLSGATLTCDGVTATLAYWFGDHGFKRYLDKLKKGDRSG